MHKLIFVIETIDGQMVGCARNYGAALVAIETFASAEDGDLVDLFIDRDVPMVCNGIGSIFALQFSREPVKRTEDISAGCLSLRPLLHMELLLEGVLLCGRGDMFLSLPMDEEHFDKARSALDTFIKRHRDLILEVYAGPSGKR